MERKTLRDKHPSKRMLLTSNPPSPLSKFSSNWLTCSLLSEYLWNFAVTGVLYVKVLAHFSRFFANILTMFPSLYVVVHHPYFSDTPKAVWLPLRVIFLRPISCSPLLQSFAWPFTYILLKKRFKKKLISGWTNLARSFFSDVMVGNSI